MYKLLDFFTHNGLCQVYRITVQSRWYSGAYKFSIAFSSGKILQYSSHLVIWWLIYSFHPPPMSIGMVLKMLVTTWSRKISDKSTWERHLYWCVRFFFSIRDLNKTNLSMTVTVFSFLRFFEIHNRANQLGTHDCPLHTSCLICWCRHGRVLSIYFGSSPVQAPSRSLSSPSGAASLMQGPC